MISGSHSIFRYLCNTLFLKPKGSVNLCEQLCLRKEFLLIVFNYRGGNVEKDYIFRHLFLYHVLLQIIFFDAELIGVKDCCIVLPILEEDYFI